MLASDSQITYSTTGQPVKQTGKKIFAPWTNVAWGGSGDGGILQTLDNHLRGTFPNPQGFETMTIPQARQTLVTHVVARVRQMWLQQIISVQGQTPPVTSYLFVGHFPDGPLILEIGINLVDVDHIQAGAAYAAIGSGDIFPYVALTGLAHYDVQHRSLFEAKLIAYRVVDDAIKVAAQYLGPPVQMIEIKKPAQTGQPGTTHVLDGNDIRMLQDKIAEWKTTESEELSRLVGIKPSGSSSGTAAFGDAEPPPSVEPQQPPGKI